MRIVIAPNAFKESLSAWEVAESLRAGLREALPDAEFDLAPMADGGDGTAETLVRATGGRMVRARVMDPLHRTVASAYGMLGDGSTGVIEMASASGLRLLSTRERNPMKTSTFGTGQLIRAALKRGIRKIIIGIGGSATVDGGTGMAAALGYRFLDRHGRELKPCGGHLHQISTIDSTSYQRWLKSHSEVPNLIIACDVTNPLLGAHGAARIFGPQKGATPRQVEQLDKGLSHLAEIIQRHLGTDVTRISGGGAAGGLGAGLVAFCGAKIQSGAHAVADVLNLDTRIKHADWIITGEGRLDSQTAFGKAPAIVAEIAARHDVPVIGVAGSLSSDASILYDKGFRSLFSICDGPMSLDEAIRDAARLVQNLGRAIGGMIRGAAIH